MAMQTKLALLQRIKYNMPTGSTWVRMKRISSFNCHDVSYCLQLERGIMGHKPASFARHGASAFPAARKPSQLSSDQQWRFGMLLNQWVFSMFFYVFLWFSMVFLGSFWIYLCSGIVLLSWNRDSHLAYSHGHLNHLSEDTKMLGWIHFCMP